MSQPKKTALVNNSPVSFADIEVTREFATSKDGTKVPLNIIRKKGTKLDGNNPTLLYGYGGYGVSMQPNFDFTRRLWFDRGGVYVVANIRGGGEFGEEWHKAGNLTKKQNVFDDFAASAEYLINEKWTRAGEAGDPGREQRRVADGRNVHATSRSDARGGVSRRNLRHAAGRTSAERRL